MNWPRGRYNGARIVGVEIRLVFDILDWGLQRSQYGNCWRLGPIRLWLSAAYSYDDLHGRIRAEQSPLRHFPDVKR